MINSASPKTIMDFSCVINHLHLAQNSCGELPLLSISLFLLPFTVATACLTYWKVFLQPLSPTLLCLVQQTSMPNWSATLEACAMCNLPSLQEGGILFWIPPPPDISVTFHLLFKFPWPFLLKFLSLVSTLQTPVQQASLSCLTPRFTSAHQLLVTTMGYSFQHPLLIMTCNHESILSTHSYCIS
jgi:hypothetical protein